MKISTILTTAGTCLVLGFAGQAFAKGPGGDHGGGPSKEPVNCMDPGNFPNSAGAVCYTDSNGNDVTLASEFANLCYQIDTATCTKGSEIVDCRNLDVLTNKTLEADSKLGEDKLADAQQKLLDISDNVTGSKSKVSQDSRDAITGLVDAAVQCIADNADYFLTN